MADGSQDAGVSSVPLDMRWGDGGFGRPYAAPKTDETERSLAEQGFNPFSGPRAEHPNFTFVHVAIKAFPERAADIVSAAIKSSPEHAQLLIRRAIMSCPKETRAILDAAKKLGVFRLRTLLTALFAIVMGEVFGEGRKASAQDNNQEQNRVEHGAILSPAAVALIALGLVIEAKAEEAADQAAVQAAAQDDSVEAAVQDAQIAMAAEDAAAEGDEIYDGAHAAHAAVEQVADAQAQQEARGPVEAQTSTAAGTDATVTITQTESTEALPQGHEGEEAALKLASTESSAGSGLAAQGSPAAWLYAQLGLSPGDATRETLQGVAQEISQEIAQAVSTIASHEFRELGSRWTQLDQRLNTLNLDTNALEKWIVRGDTELKSVFTRIGAQGSETYGKVAGQVDFLESHAKLLGQAVADLNAWSDKGAGLTNSVADALDHALGLGHQNGPSQGWVGATASLALAADTFRAYAQEGESLLDNIRGLADELAGQGLQQFDIALDSILDGMRNGGTVEARMDVWADRVELYAANIEKRADGIYGTALSNLTNAVSDFDKKIASVTDDALLLDAVNRLAGFDDTQPHSETQALANWALFGDAFEQRVDALLSNSTQNGWQSAQTEQSLVALAGVLAQGPDGSDAHLNEAARDGLAALQDAGAMAHLQEIAAQQDGQGSQTTAAHAASTVIAELHTLYDAAQHTDLLV
jgi:hypothetical protein